MFKLLVPGTAVVAKKKIIWALNYFRVKKMMMVFIFE